MQNTNHSLNYLIVGGRSEAGQSAIQAIREHHANAAARIIATSSAADAGMDSVPGADAVIAGIDLNQPDAAESLMQGLRNLDPDTPEPPAIDVLFFTPAFGPIGYPIRAATVADAEEAIQFSVAPMRALADGLKPRLTVGYSAFYWLPHARVGYGSMSYAKVLLDTLAHEESERFRAIRGGTFRSPATRGIGLLLQRALKTTEHLELKELGAEYKKGGGKFSDFFFKYAFSHEAQAFGEQFAQTPHRPTERDDLKQATLRILQGEDAPVLCVIGDWVWPENQMPDLDADVFRIKDEVLNRHGF
ncbi:MAG: SDR family NAD(P)-dependent oxidoreductase [bacterium]|nr:SDR family NAD(P)-dependent oxidoreductase [bacterium]